MFRLFKEVQQVGGHESVSRAKGWPDLAASMGFPTLALGQAMKDAYMRYLADFEVRCGVVRYDLLLCGTV